MSPVDAFTAAARVEVLRLILLERLKKAHVRASHLSCSHSHRIEMCDGYSIKLWTATDVSINSRSQLAHSTLRRLPSYWLR